MTLLLFVYGTLSPDLAPVDLLPFVNRLKELGEASIQGTMYDMGQYPAVLQTHPDSGKVYGRIYRLGNSESEALELLAKFDEYEDFDPRNPAESLFIRREVRASLLDGKEIECWAYFYNRSPGTARKIENGIYSRANR